ncbi:helicase-related protein [Ensifer sp. BR816]|uniref:helicase-related protein n=1 Tax=Rhizobium sp. (strain BR816) TaxID=1057002 RepID=UPI000362B93A|nr:helicase-related protein [Ensifer sp. BR816]
MAHDDSFTLDMFGSSALSSGSNLGITGLGGFTPTAALEPANDDDPDPTPPAPAPAMPGTTPRNPAVRKQGDYVNFYLDDGDRGLGSSWKERAKTNVAAILLAAEIDKQERAATRGEQAKLVRFTGFGAGELANGMFRRPGEVDFRAGWDELGSSLETAVTESDYSSLARCTQYAHFTPEFIIRAIWAGLLRLGWRGGRVLEPGIGTGLFPALMPVDYRDNTHLTGVELDPVTARIVKLLQPRARIITGDFARTELPASFDLAIGNPPFSDRIVRSDRAYRSLGLRLHDYFIARSIDLLKPGALAAFVTSHGTMDKADNAARAQMARSADLIAAIRLPEGSFRADAGTDVVVDILFFRKRKIGERTSDLAWLDLDDVRAATVDEGAIRVNRWFARHPDFVLGKHALTSGPFGETYTCRSRLAQNLGAALDAAIGRLPQDFYDGEPTATDLDLEHGDRVIDLPSDRHVREGSFLFDTAFGLAQIIDGEPAAVTVRKGRTGEGLPEKQVGVIRKLIPIRDAVREVLKCQECDQPSKGAQVRLRIAWSSFVRAYGPINHTKVSIAEDPETGEVRETHRRPNLQPFLDDPACWLVASIEDYDLETDTAKPGPIFSERVISPPAPPDITSAADALAVVLNERGHVDLDHIAELVHCDRDAVIAELGEAIFQDPADGAWQTADAYLSGHVRDKLKVAEAAAALQPAYERNVRALTEVQPADLRPSEITARLGSPWIPASDVVAFVKETMAAEIRIHHLPELASWTVEARQLGWTAAGTSEWGTDRRHAGELLADALNSRVPQIFDTIKAEMSERRVLNVVDTEAAKEKLAKIKSAFQSWVWSDPDRTDRLARVYNDRFNNIAPRKFDGAHLKLPGASSAFTLYPHQKRGIWRIIASGSTYLAHAVGAGKTMTMAAAVMEQRRLKRQIVTSRPTAAFKRYQTVLDARIKAIEERDRPPEPGDDILLSVITDGRHAAIDLRLVDAENDNEPANKLNSLIACAYRIWRDTADRTYVRPDGKRYELPGAAQMIFSDLGTISVEKARGFSAYRWIRDELVRLGVPPSEIAFMQDYRKAEAKQRLFGDVRAGKVRFLIGSSDTMGTGVNAQARLKALHHLDVPWLPSQIEQREGRIVRQGNQHDEVDIFAYATEGSLDATMWQNNERKARFIAAALSGDTSIRRLEDLGEGQANQFAMAKAIASGDQRLMQKAGLEADIARLERLRAAHEDDQFAIRRQIRDAERDIEYATRRINEIGQDLGRLDPTAGEAFVMTITEDRFFERKPAGRALMKEILTRVQLQQEEEVVIAAIGGFDLVYAGERFGKDGYRYQTMLKRTGADHEIDLAVTVTPLGAVARLEHALDGFEGERERFRQRLEDSRRRLVSYQSRQGSSFAFAAELADKRRQLSAVEKALADDPDRSDEHKAG